MNRLYCISLLIGCMLFSLGAQAQFGGGIHFNYTSPLDQYDKNLVKDPKGFSLSAFYSPSKAPLWQVGTEFGVAMYANESYFTTGDDGVTTVEVDEEDCFLTYHATVRRFLVKDKLINPYAEIRAGGVSFFSTRFAAKEKYEDDFSGQTTFHGTAFNVGFGGGVNLNFIEGMLFDLGVIYNRGSRTYYRSIEGGEGGQLKTLADGRRESYVNSLTIRLGMTFGF